MTTLETSSDFVMTKDLLRWRGLIIRYWTLFHLNSQKETGDPPMKQLFLKVTNFAARFRLKSEYQSKKNFRLRIHFFSLNKRGRNTEIESMWQNLKLQYRQLIWGKIQNMLSNSGISRTPKAFMNHLLQLIVIRSWISTIYTSYTMQQGLLYPMLKLSFHPCAKNFAHHTLT